MKRQIKSVCVALCLFVTLIKIKVDVPLVVRVLLNYSMKLKPKKKVVKAWADVGSHGGIFEFVAGPVARKYPKLMHIYKEKYPGLIEVTITYTIKNI